MERWPIGTTEIMISPVAFGGWPITGITTLDVDESHSLASLRACLEVGINFFDTAYVYGPRGESERLIGRAVAECRDDVVIATKGGAHWNEEKNQVYDGSPARLRYECDESLRRLNVDRVDLLYLHAPDPQVPLAESAGALRELMEQSKTRCIGTSNMTVAVQYAAAADRGGHAAVVSGTQRFGNGILALDDGPLGRQAFARSRLFAARRPGQILYVSG